MAKAPATDTVPAPAVAASSRWRQLAPLVLMVGAGTSLGGVAVWYLTAPAQKTPAERLTEAIEYLDAGRDRKALELAEELEAERYHDADFAGGVEYVLGLAHFRHAMLRPLSDAGAELATAIVYLREAERRGIPDERRADWTYAMAKSLYNIGEFSQALPLLESATRSNNPHRIEAARDLTDLYLDPDWRSNERLQYALQLNSEIIASEDEDRSTAEARLHRAQILIALERYAEATEVLDEVAREPEWQQATSVLTSRILIGEQRFIEAVQLLETVAGNDPLDREYPRQACYLAGYAAEQHARQSEKQTDDVNQLVSAANERAEYRRRAAEFYRMTVNRFENTDEALAAYLQLGRLQQEEGAHERAIQSYGAALKSVRRTEDFRNRWISLDEFRQRILLAWNAWIQSERFSEAIALADLMAPTFPRDQAYELSARVRQRWAELTVDKLLHASASERREGEATVRRLWRESGQAFARLAQARRTAADYPDAVWQSAEHFYRGHDFESALQYVDMFLGEAPEAMRPVALVRRGEILLDLDRAAEAEADFRSVVAEYPTSPAAFSALHQIALCRLEQNDISAAEQAWRGILDSPKLTPAATEWRDSLLSLGKLQVTQASWARRKLESRTAGDKSAEDAWTNVINLSREGAVLLEQYASRYPQSPQLMEARFFLGKALQLQGDWWRRQWQAAETENARQQSHGEMLAVFERALAHFQQARDALTKAAKEDQLDAVQASVLGNVWFEIPHTLFALGKYRDAITAYGSAIHKHPQDVRVLTAYVQMAEAYALLDRPVEAKSMLEQAKVILDQDQIPAAAFDAPTTTLTKLEWEQWLGRARQAHR